MEVKSSNLLIKIWITVPLEGVLSSYLMKVSSDYVQLLCLLSTKHMPCTHRVGCQSVFPLMFDKVCTVLYPTYRNGVECDWKAHISCKRHFELQGSIPCQRKNSSILQSVQTGYVTFHTSY